MFTHPITVLAALCPGESFTKEHTPFVVWVKDTHTWARVTWKGQTSRVPMHPTERVRRAEGKSNP